MHIKSSLALALGACSALTLASSSHTHGDQALHRRMAKSRRAQAIEKRAAAAQRESSQSVLGVCAPFFVPPRLGRAPLSTHRMGHTAFSIYNNKALTVSWKQSSVVTMSSLPRLAGSTGPLSGSRSRAARARAATSTRTSAQVFSCYLDILFSHAAAAHRRNEDYVVGLSDEFWNDFSQMSPLCNEYVYIVNTDNGNK